LDSKVKPSIIILGFSTNPGRYSNILYHKLRGGEIPFYLVNERYQNLRSPKVYGSLAQLPTSLHTLSIYVNPEISTSMQSQILAIAPQRVIFNPGSENLSLAKSLESKGIQVLHACSIVLFQTGQLFPHS
jgi:uncharacterized protein